SPKEKRRCAKVLVACVGTAILVESSFPKSQRQDGRNRCLLLVCQPDLKGVTQALDQVLKPLIGLRREVETSPGEHEKVVEILQQGLGSAGVFGEIGPFSPANPPEDRI